MSTAKKKKIAKKPSKKVTTKRQAKVMTGLHMMGIGDVKTKGNITVIHGLANKNVIDRGQDIIEVDAWDLENFKKNPVILYNHGLDPQLGSTPIGKAIEISPTKDGLFVKVQLSSIDDPVINRIRGLVEERILRAFSVGFDPKESDTDRETGVKSIKKCELFEISIVGVPMNQDSLFELSSKMMGTKSINCLKKEVLEKKGARLAGAVHNRIFEMQETGVSRETILESLASQSEQDLDVIMDVLAGNSTPDDKVIAALSTVLEIESEHLEELNMADRNVGVKKEDEEEIKVESADEETNDEETNDEEMKDGIEKSNDDENTDDDEIKDEELKILRDDVSKIIPSLIAQGVGQDLAISQAITQCLGDRKIRPPLELYKHWFKVASQPFEKQADQGFQSDQVTQAIAAENTEAENNDFGNPQLEAQKQTNILLGAIANKMDLLMAKMDHMIPVDKVPEPQITEQLNPQTVNNEKNNKKTYNSNDTIETIDDDYIDKYAIVLKNIRQRLDSLSQ